MEWAWQSGLDAGLVGGIVRELHTARRQRLRRTMRVRRGVQRWLQAGKGVEKVGGAREKKERRMGETCNTLL